MKPLHWPPLLRLKGRWLDPLLSRIGTMPERDRIALLAAGLALAGAAEWFLVWPMHRQRDSIVEAVRAQTQADLDTAQLAQHEREQRQTALEARTRLLDADLARLGVAASSGQRLSVLLARTLLPQPVRVLALREVGVDEIDAPASRADEPRLADAGIATAVAADAGQSPAAAAAPASPVRLYRHRFELRLAGPLPALLAALAAVEKDVRPLRTERVRLAPGEHGDVELTLGLVVLGTERVWLSL